MTLRTVTFPDDQYKVVPIEATAEIVHDLHYFRSEPDGTAYLPFWKHLVDCVPDTLPGVIEHSGEPVAYFEKSASLGSWFLAYSRNKNAETKALFTHPAPAQPSGGSYISPVRTVADMVNNLLLIDQALPIYGAQYIECEGRRRAIAVPPTVSYERLKDRRWIGEGEPCSAVIIWTRAAAPDAPTQPVERQELSEAIELLKRAKENVLDANGSMYQTEEWVTRAIAILAKDRGQA